MKTVSTLILLVCAALLVAGTLSSHRQLPEVVASHFNGSGVANGWSSRTTFTVSMLAVGFGVPALVVGIMFCLRFLPAKYLNVPNPAYWRSPENYQRACDFLFLSSLWFASAFLLWQAFFSRAIVEANLATPPHLDTAKTLLLTVPLLIFTLAWTVILVVWFQKSASKSPTPHSLCTPRS